MVLHLLGKKSWNVYNADNVARVRRDEADARTREEAQEQRMQDEDAARRLAILRGESPPALIEAAEPVAEQGAHGRDRIAHHSQPRKRRRKGEDETDAEIRHARQDVEAGEEARKTLARPSKGHEDAPLVDHAGHLQLIPAPDEKEIRKQSKTADVDAKKKCKREEEEQQSTGMRFQDAAGFNSRGVKPWYTSQQDSAAAGLGVQGKDVWGNEDPRRHEREIARTSKSDPFAAMQQAQRQLKQSERDREQWRRERDREMEGLRREEERRERRGEKRKKKHRDEEDALDGFMLDGVPTNQEGEHDLEKRRERRHRHRRRHRSRSRSLSRSRDRRRSKD